MSEIEWAALQLSLKVSLTSVTLLLIPGVALGYLLARRDFPGKSVLEAAVQLPMVLPPVVTGYALLMLFGQRGWLGSWMHQLGIDLSFNWKGAAVAAAIMSFPLLVRSVRVSMAAIDRRLEQAASTLGASPLNVFVSVTLPLAYPGIIAGLVLAFARSLGEFGATITFVGNIEGETQTLPLALYSFTQTPGGESAALRLVVISAVIALAAVILSEVLVRRAELHQSR